MDQIVDKTNIITPILVIITYLSAFKNEKPTCDRYLINNFLYLLTFLSVYLLSLKKSDDYKIEYSTTRIVISIFLLIGAAYLYYSSENIFIKHLACALLVIIIAYSGKKLYDKYDKEDINKVLVKLMMVLTVCVLVAVLFPNLIKPKMEIILIFALFIGVLFRIIDHFFMDEKYDSVSSTIFIMIFSGFMIYDTDRILKLKKLCIDNKLPADYLMNISNMFLDIINLFNTMLRSQD